MATTKELKREYYQHIAEIGGFWELKEADNTNNDLNRAIIKAFKQENDKAYLGFINLPDDKYKALNEGKEVLLFEEYTDQEVYNFGCDFIIPVADDVLESMIKKWNSKEGYAKGMVLVEAIHNRIAQLGGLFFVWS